MVSDEPLSLDHVRGQLRARLAFLEKQIAPLVDEAEEIRGLLKENSPRDHGWGDSTREAIAEAVQRTPGLSGADYSTAVGVTGATALRHLKALSEAGIVRRDGERRNTRWHPA